jgi:hypothetical protein
MGLSRVAGEEREEMRREGRPIEELPFSLSELEASSL